MRLTLATFLIFAAGAGATDLTEATGVQIMSAVYERHQQYPHVYEEQSMILIDRHDNRETRKLRRYSRYSEAGVADFLLLFDSPEEVVGVAMRATQDATGKVTENLFLPAFGRTMIGRNDGSDPNGIRADENFLGTDYSIEDIAGELLSDYHYERGTDFVVEDVPQYVVEVFPLDSAHRAHLLRRHYIRQDVLYIIRTDYFNNVGQLRKRQTHHDLVAVAGDKWRANMMLMENFEDAHQTIVKINRRIFSADWVPEEVFTEQWLFLNARVDEAEEPAIATEENES